MLAASSVINPLKIAIAFTAFPIAESGTTVREMSMPSEKPVSTLGFWEKLYASQSVLQTAFVYMYALLLCLILRTRNVSPLLV